MATETDETYLRKYLNDPTSIDASNNPVSIPETLATDVNVNYYRKYLNDPQQ